GDTVKDCLDPNVDTDGDGTLNPADSDDDGDGFSDARERAMTTDALGACPAAPGHDAWPPDRNGDTDADVGDVIALFSGKILLPNAYSALSDFDADGNLDVGDVITGFGGGKINTRCSAFTLTNGTGGPVDDVHIDWSSAISQVFVAVDSDLRPWPNRALSGGGLALDVDRPDAQGDLAAGGRLTIVVRGTAPAIGACRWTLDGVDKGAC
ncbi:MAG TPA: hypothetical protein VFT91_03670, partial [Dehalococcoidia bacterium]|nr:hypothetical protein [Dehalococcoidia bacterium]